MLNNRFFTLKKPKLAYVYYHYDCLLYTSDAADE